MEALLVILIFVYALRVSARVRRFVAELCLLVAVLAILALLM